MISNGLISPNKSLNEIYNKNICLNLNSKFENEVDKHNNPKPVNILSYGNEGYAECSDKINSYDLDIFNTCEKQTRDED